MARTIYQKGQGFGESGELEADEQFTEAEVLDAALALITHRRGTDYADLTAIISVEWDRKGFTQRSSIDYENPSYRSGDDDDLIVSLELRIPGYNRREEKVKELQAAVRTVIATRTEESLAAEVEALEAEAAVLAERERDAAAELERTRLKLKVLRGTI